MPSALPPSNLPLPASALIGRATEMAAVQTALTRHTTQTVMLTGPPGVGKTHLGLHAALALRDNYPDGVYFVPLDAVSDATRVLAAIAHCLDLPDVSEQALAATLREALDQRHLLLVLDSLEHVPTFASTLPTLLADCPHVRLIATSRISLTVPAADEIVVAPLAVPNDATSLDLGAMIAVPAVELFVRKAREAKTDFFLTDANAPFIAEICRRLDGLPLAIELAAARIRVLTPQALLTRLDNRLAVLTRGQQDASARQRTLRACIAWSYDMLDEAEKRLFRQLAVFAGGATLAAIEAICDADGPVAGLLVSLTHKSLIRLEEIHQASRYTMLQTIREFAAEELDRAGEATAARTRHLAYFTAVAETAEPGLLGAEQARWLRHLSTEHDNLHTALDWAMTAEGGERRDDSSDSLFLPLSAVALRLGGALWRYWYIRGHLTLGREYLARLLMQPPTGQPPATLARLLQGAGTLASAQGDYSLAQTYLEASLSLYQQMSDRHSILVLLNSLGALAHRQDDLRLALKRYVESLGIARELEDTSWTSRILNNLAILHAQQGDWVQARQWLTDALATFRDIGEPWGIANALLNLGEVCLDVGDLEAARGYLRESLAGSMRIGNVALMAAACEVLARMAVAQGQAEAGLRLAGAGNRLRSEIGQPLVRVAQIKLDASLAPARVALGDTLAQAMWASGQALTREEAVALANAV